MRNLTLCFILALSFFGKINLLNSQISLRQIDSLDLIGETRKSVSLSLEYMKINGEKKLLLYNTACRYAKLNEIDSSFYFLNRAIDLGLKEIYFLVDEDLNILHSNPEWSNIEKCVLQEFHSKNTDLRKKELAIEIIKMGFKDQNTRQMIVISRQNNFDQKNVDSLERIQKRYDSLSTIFIVNLIKTNDNRFPDLIDIGESASRYAFLMLQHADFEIRKKHFKVIRLAYKENQLQGKYFAMYKDRLLVNQGKKQLYGTQFEKTENGTLEILPVKNWRKMNRKRKKLNMEELYEKN